MGNMTKFFLRKAGVKRPVADSGAKPGATFGATSGAISIAASLLLALAVSLSACGAAQGNQNNSASPPPARPSASQRLDTGALARSGNPVLELMAVSFSAGVFAEGKVTESDIELILMSGQKAPSAKNDQPWHFTVVTNYEIASGLLSFTKRGNVLIIVSGWPGISTDTLAFDCGLAAQNIHLAAEALGYGTRMYIQCVGDIEKRRDELGIPEGYIVQVAILVGPSAVDAVTSATPRNALDYHSNYVT